MKESNPPKYSTIMRLLPLILTLLPTLILAQGASDLRQNQVDTLYLIISLMLKTLYANIHLI